MVKMNIKIIPTDKDQKHSRKKWFEEFAKNENNFLTFAEVEKGIRDKLKMDDLFQCKEVIIRAFTVAKSFKSTDSKKKDVANKEYSNLDANFCID